MSKVSSSALALVKRRSESEDPTLPLILEYNWPSTAIVNAPVPRSARGVIWVVASMFFVIVATMGLISIDQVVAARGVVVAKSGTILVQPLDTSIVRSINVHEGQEVKAGQLLARLDPTFAAADLAALQTQVSSLEAQAARLKAEATGKTFTYTGSDPNWLVQVAIFGHRKAEFDAKVSSYNEKIDELKAAVSRSVSDAAAYRERLGVAQSVENMRQKLEKLKVGSQLNLLLAKDSRVEMQRSLSSAEQTAEEAKRSQAAVAQDRDAYIRGWQADVSQQLSDVAGKLNDAQEKLKKAKLVRRLVELSSDTDAIVQSVAKVSVGSVLQSGQQFISLVPADAPLEVEANISGHDNGYVHTRDPVAIKFDTFPFSRYGMAEGTVRIVSPDSFNAESEARNPTNPIPVSSSEPFYRSRISIDHVGLHGVPAGFHLIPGMPVTADIKVGKRTVLQYLLERILPVGQEGMREPS